MVTEAVYTYQVVFFLFRFVHVVNYKRVKWEPFSVDLLQRQNLKILQVQVTPDLPSYHDEMENRRI